VYGFELEGSDVSARFDVEVDGDHIKYEVGNVYYDSDGWTEELTGNAVWTTTFAPGEKKTVTVLYYCNYGTQGAPSGCGEFYYVLYTGAPWKGPIGEGRITVKPGDDFDWTMPILPRTMDMPPLSVYDDRLEWTFEDFEPAAPDYQEGVKIGIWNGSAIEIVVPRGKEVLPDNMKAGYEGPTGTIGDEAVNLYEEPQVIGIIRQGLEKIPENSLVTLLERRGKWYYVKYDETDGFSEGIKGWLRWHEYDDKTNEERYNIVEITVY
jgi:hypothetical protein